MRIVMLLSCSWLISLLCGCIELGRSWSDTTETIQVDYYKEQCDNDSTSLCFRIRDTSSDSWAVVQEPFSGFSDFVWGYRYSVKVRVSYDEDGNPDNYRFQEVVSTDAVTDAENTFGLTVYSDTGIFADESDSVWNLGNELSFPCNEACSDLAAAVANSYIIQLEFTVADGVVELSSVLCASGSDDFSSSCEGESTVSWRIGWYQSDCGFADAQMCLLYKVNSSDDYELLRLDTDIADFSPVWGEQYNISVVKTVSNGGTITAVTLDENDSSPDDRTSSTYPFYFIVRGSELDNSSSGLISLYDGAPSLDCDSYNLCSKINGYIDDDQWLLFKAYLDTDIVATSVVCHNDNIDTFRSCVDDEDNVNWGI
jgi:hypothetical protein